MGYLNGLDMQPTSSEFWARILASGMVINFRVEYGCFPGYPQVRRVTCTQRLPGLGIEHTHVGCSNIRVMKF